MPRRRRPLRPERAALALWARPVHASSMAGSTADENLTVDGDAMFVVGADPEHAACTSPRAADHQIVDGRTQHHPLSAPVNNRLVCGAQGGTGSVLWSAAATNIAFPPLAQR